MYESLPILIIEILMLIAFLPMLLHERARPPLSTSIPFSVLAATGSGISMYQGSTVDAILYGLTALLFIVLALQRKYIDGKN